MGTLLQCYGDKSISWTFPDSPVSSVVHSNKSAVTNLSRSKSLWIMPAMPATVKFIPTGIKKKFTNLKALVIHSSGLLTAESENGKFEGIWKFTRIHRSRIQNLEHLSAFENLLFGTDNF